MNGRRGYCDPPIYFHYEVSAHTLSAINMQQNRAYCVVHDMQTLPWWMAGSPLLVIIHVWLREKGLQLTHAAAIGNGQTSLLLVGKGGSGKSTSTLACLTEGSHYLGEDYCIIDSQQIPNVFSLYQSAKWEANTRALFPQYEHFITNPETANDGKALLYYQDIFPRQMQISAPIRAVLSLTIGKQNNPILQEYDSSSTLKDVVMSTLLQLPFYHPRTISILQNLVKRVKTYRLILGQDIKANTQTIQSLLTKEKA